MGGIHWVPLSSQCGFFQLDPIQHNDAWPKIGSEVSRLLPTHFSLLFLSMSKRKISLELASRPLRQCYQGREREPATPLTRPKPHSLLVQGKYVGRTFEYVAREDRSYVEWALREERSGELSTNLAAFVGYVKHAYGGILTVGKHKGLYFTELMEKDPEYADWCRTIGSPGDILRAFADWQARKGPPKACSDTHKASKDDDTVFGRKCMFCLEKPMSAAWIPCGHMVACYSCATSMPHSQRCPICRQFGLIQKLFVG